MLLVCRFTCNSVLCVIRDQFYSGQKLVTNWIVKTCFRIGFTRLFWKRKNLIYRWYIRFLLYFAVCCDCFQGWKMGLEPTTFGTTIRRSNRLSYIHRVTVVRSYRDANVIYFFGPCKKIARKIAPRDKMTVRHVPLSPRICQKPVGTSIEGKEIANAN